MDIKINLLNSLKNLNAFWSYNLDDISEKTISDEILIEKSLVYLDIGELKQLFLLFPRQKIKKVWKNQLCIQEPYYHELNTMLAFLFFNIKKPEKYLKNLNNRNIKLLKHNSDEWFNKEYGKDF